LPASVEVLAALNTTSPSYNCAGAPEDGWYPPDSMPKVFNVNAPLSVKLALVVLRLNTGLQVILPTILGTPTVG
jgi:hypothetical protein